MCYTDGRKGESTMFGKPKTSHWIRQQHLFGRDTFACAACGRVFKQNPPRCPHCGALMTKEKADPVWVDEMADFDDL